MANGWTSVPREWVENAGEELPAARVAEMVPAVGMALR